MDHMITYPSQRLFYGSVSQVVKSHKVNHKSVMQHLCDHGNLSILAFGHQIVHIMPWDIADVEYGPVARGVGAGTVPIEVAGSWLSHRPASRKGDEIVIWSLLPQHGTKAIHNVVEFWRSQRTVNSGFLLSSAERLEQRGLTWAPKTSYAVPTSGSKNRATTFYRPVPSQESAVVTIDEQGIFGEWYIHEFDPRVISQTFKALPLRQERTATELELRKIRSKFVRMGRTGALLHTSNNSVPHYSEGLPSSEHSLSFHSFPPGERS